MKDKKLKIAVTSTLPFVIEKNGKYSGFEIDLWEMIAKEIGVSFEYSKHNFQELIPLTVKKKVDVCLGAITIREEREEIVDFSHSIFGSGLRILLSKNRSKIDIAGTLRIFIVQGYKQLIKPIVALLMLIIIFGNILWLVERTGGSIDQTYFPGVLQAIWLSLCMIIGSDGSVFVYEITSWIGRFIGTLLQLTSLAVLGLIIGEITAFITTNKIRLNIDGPEDLKGKVVATVRDTTSESVLKGLGAKVVSVVNIDKAYEKLRKNQVEAIVFDSPVLTFFALNDGAEWAEVVGGLFDVQDYGIMLQEGSSLRKKVNLAILNIREKGYYDELYKKWFKEAQ